METVKQILLKWALKRRDGTGKKETIKNEAAFIGR